MLSEDQLADVQGFFKVIAEISDDLHQAVRQEGFSQTEYDVLLEISRTQRSTANLLASQLHLDRSYLSRMLGNLEKQELIERYRSDTDSRVRFIRLTEKGQEELNRITDLQKETTQNAFFALSEENQNELVSSMIYVRNQLSRANDRVSFRPFRSGDLEYVISRHKTLYYAERRLSPVFFDYVEKIVRGFAEDFNPDLEFLQITERNGAPAGSIAVRNAGVGWAQLRFFMLEPELRQRGYGNRMIEQALEFCRKKGYENIFLLTITDQVVARHIYETHGFHKTGSWEKSEWGEGVVEERWERKL